MHTLDGATAAVCAPHAALQLPLAITWLASAHVAQVMALVQAVQPESKALQGSQ